jgi:hypothetical protein
MLDESTFQYVHDQALGNLNGLLATLEKDNLGTAELAHMNFLEARVRNRELINVRVSPLYHS